MDWRWYVYTPLNFGHVSLLKCGGQTISQYLLFMLIVRESSLSLGKEMHLLRSQRTQIRQDHKEASPWES